ncbi:MAG: type I 3-dehydroquinate dehydratase [Lachnospirales bacterium]
MNNKSIKIKNVVIGDGIPKICVSIAENTYEEVINKAKHLSVTPVDIIEWRADFFDEIFSFEKVKALLIELNKTYKDIPILFTFRTLPEGGNKNISEIEYLKLLEFIVDTELVDLIDIEVSIGYTKIKDFIIKAHNKNINVIGSKHNFNFTPSKEDIICILKDIEHLGVDIPKVAFMPKDTKDVLSLLEATVLTKERMGEKPFIAISMGAYGIISRLSCEIFGASITFASFGTQTASGQIDVTDLDTVRKIIHKNIT